MADGESPERRGLRGRFNAVLLMTSRALWTLGHALATVAAIHYLWLTLGSSWYQRVTSDNDIQPEMSVGIFDENNWLSLAAGPVIGGRNRGNSSTVRVLVDCGVFGHYPDDYTTPGPRNEIFNDGQKALTARGPVSYTHLTLPTIYSV